MRITAPSIHRFGAGIAERKDPPGLGITAVTAKNALMRPGAHDQARHLDSAARGFRFGRVLGPVGDHVDSGWRVHEIPVGHNITRRDPYGLAAVLGALPPAGRKP